MKTTHKLFWIFATAFAVCATAFGVDFPQKPNALVTDLAGMLSPADHTKLEVELRQYEKDTSIEIAVLTVVSLQDLPPEDYANQLFRSWGIGKKGKDNGVLLLFAPTEKKIRIEVGIGLEPDLTDIASGEIIRQTITPTYRSGKVSESVVDGAEAVIKSLGNKPYEERAAERQKEAAESSSDSNLVWPIFGTVLIVVGLVFFFRKRVSNDGGDDDDRSLSEAAYRRRLMASGADRLQPRAPMRTPSSYVPIVPIARESKSNDGDSGSISSNSRPADDEKPFDFGGGTSEGGGATGDL